MRWPNGSQSRPNVSSGYGPRAPGVGSSWHLGTDYTGIGQIRAIASGTVSVVGTPGGWSGGGRQVWIQHDGFFTRSMHMGSFAVGEGQHVDEGQFIGTEDTTGAADGSHLHLEVTLGGVHFSNSGQIDSVAFISQRVTGGSDSETKQLQTDLNFLGYPLDADGDYGPATEAAVTKFQQDNPPLAVDGDAGPATKAEIVVEVKALQTAFVRIGYVITMDGVTGPQTIATAKDFQSKNGLTADGICGPQTRSKLGAAEALPNGYNSIPLVRSTSDIQRLVGADPDGIWGPKTTEAVVAWQKANKDKATPPLVVDGIWGPAADAVGFPKTPSAYIPVTVDGKWGKETITALQANLGIIASLKPEEIGVENEATIKALQIAVGVPTADQDGIMGPQTTKHLQSSLGVRVDGQMGPATITALQTLLNRSGKLLPVPFVDEGPPPEHPQPAKPTYPDAAKWAHSVNSSPRTGKVQLLILHHWGTDPIPSADGQWKRFNTALVNNPVSPTWQVNNDGSAYEAVPPDAWRPWTTGMIDMQAVTIETQNETVGPNWGISQAAIHRIAKILAFSAKRWNFPIQMGEVGPNNVVIKPGLIGHNMTPAGQSTGTVCPGPAMKAAYQQILSEAREINNPTTPPVEPPPIDPPPTEPIEIPPQDYADMMAAWADFQANHVLENESYAALESQMEKLPPPGVS